MESILSVSAAPGYSEHHGGTAVDLTAPGTKPLDEAFRRHQGLPLAALECRHLRFRESYPMNNRHGISWEPWHWRYHHRPGV
jgi:zinc D-Ala-D-Ala carboxypeptidase